MPATRSRTDAAPVARGPRGGGWLALLAALAAFAFLGFVALGNWQIERRAWKLDLIERVEARLAAAPVDAPGPPAWPAIGTDDEYRRVQATGVFDHQRETLVQATTGLGGGFWVMTPLRRPDGTTVLVNRGFVTPAQRDPAQRGPAPTGEVTVAGLLRLSEPGGGFLRENDPAADRWHSRDVQAIAATRGLERTAPYFIDADAATAPPAFGDPGTRTWPVAGLTVVTFKNTHLVYALTWYGLALMVAAAAWFVGRDERRLRRRRDATTLRPNGDRNADVPRR